MSPEAITTRLRLTSELRDLCLSLGKCMNKLNMHSERCAVARKNIYLKAATAAKNKEGF